MLFEYCLKTIKKKCHQEPKRVFKFNVLLLEWCHLQEASVTHNVYGKWHQNFVINIYRKEKMGSGDARVYISNIE